jgi:small-conductance mechanosensitive channel
VEKFVHWETIKDWLVMEAISIGSFTINTYQIVSAVLIIVLGFIVMGLASRALRRVARMRSNMAESSIYTMTRLLNYVFYVVIGLMALSVLGISFEKMALVAGALSVGIGFGLQNIVNNFISGIIILFERSLRVGDFVELENGLLGEVRDIKIRSTLIRTLGNEDILVPNSEFISKQVNNWTLDDDYKRMSVEFGVAYGTDPRLVMSAVEKAAAVHPTVVKDKDKKPGVIFAGFGDSSLDFKLVLWVKGDMVKKPGLVRSEMLLLIHDVLKEHNIEVPFPQRDLHIRSGLDLSHSPGTSTQTATDLNAGV